MQFASNAGALDSTGPGAQSPYEVNAVNGGGGLLEKRACKRQFFHRDRAHHRIRQQQPETPLMPKWRRNGE